jgi:disulfide bond formation protein DsbB
MNAKGILRPKLLTSLVGLALLGSFVMAMWHVGVEYKWWEGPKTCLAEKVDLDAIGSGVDLLNSLNKPIKPPACADAVWHFLGLSMAGWNMVISAAGVIATAIFGFRPEKP